MGFLQNLETVLPELAKSLNSLSLSLNFGTFTVSFAAYILMALGLYTIAKKRNINHPWLAFIPVADLWLLGCISDQYHYVTKGEERKRRKRMLGLAITELVLSLILIVLIVICAVGVFAAVSSGNAPALGASVIVVAVVLLLCMVFFVGLLVVSIVLLVQQCYALYDLFCSCETQNRTLYSVLGIVGACLGISILPAILVFICREKEEGMPPRIVEPAE